MSENQKNHERLQKLTVSAMLAALSFVLAVLAKTIFGTGPLRFTIENLPIFLGSLLLGPLWGMGIAVVADLLSCLIKLMPPIPLITVGAALIGFISGIVFRLPVLKKHKNLQLFIGVFTAHIIGSMIVKSIALYQIYGSVVYFRIPIYIGTAIFESVLLLYLIKIPIIRKFQKTGNKKRSKKQ